MAKPISEIKKAEEDPETAMPRSDPAEAALGHSSDIEGLAQLARDFKESGMIDLADGLVRNYSHAVSLITEEFTTERNRNFLLNLLTIYNLLASIDSDRLSGFINNIANSVNSADSMKAQGSVGLLSLLSEIKDRDLSAGIRVMMSIMKGLTSQKQQ